MKLLLDTHVWLWMRLDPTRLAPGARKRLEDRGHEIWLSPISAWEALQLSDRGRIELDPTPQAWIAASLASMAARIVAISMEIAIASRRISLPHEDPADRFLAATAKVHDLTLMTADERLLACREIRTLRA